jgi:uncharacterized SAM-binding protein YcdF (DUF218 family)
MEKDLRASLASVSSPAIRRSLLRGWRKILAIVVVLVLVFAAITARLLVWPAQGMPADVDAIVMLAGPGDRLPVALAIARERRAQVLVVSRGHDGYSGPCPAPAPSVRLICFDPVPGNTRGEVEFAGRLARQYHWRSMVLVTTAEQDTRARMMMKRCFGGAVYVVTARQPLSSLPGQIAYGWGALLKALALVRAC